MKETITKTKAPLQVSNKLMEGAFNTWGGGRGVFWYSVVEPTTIKLRIISFLMCW